MKEDSASSFMYFYEHCFSPRSSFPYRHFLMQYCQEFHFILIPITGKKNGIIWLYKTSQVTLPGEHGYLAEHGRCKCYSEQQ
jgi:hypothetical protein